MQRTNREEEKSEERCIVPPTNAVVDPGTMVVTTLDTVVTQLAVAGTRRSVDFACGAILDSDTGITGRGKFV